MKNDKKGSSKMKRQEQKLENTWNMQDHPEAL